MPRKLGGLVCDNCTKFISFASHNAIVDWFIIISSAKSERVYCSKECRDKKESISNEALEMAKDYLERGNGKSIFPADAKIFAEAVVKLTDENAKLKNIVESTLWMARRYAHKRATYAPAMVNECIDTAINMGLRINNDERIGMYADDEMFGKWRNGKFESLPGEEK